MAKDNCIRNMKKSKSLTIPVKKVTNHVAPKTKPATLKANAQKVTAKVQAKAHRATTKAPQEAPQQAPQLSDFKLQTSVDNIGIHIITRYLNNPIHRFTLPVSEYAGWQRANPQHKHMYVQARVASAFFGDLMIINLVVTTTIQILDNIFARAQAQQRAQHRQAT